MSDISVQQAENDSGTLVLRISKESFGEFIRDLISEKKRINRDIKGTFVFKREELLDLITLIDQRVRLQNTVVLSTIQLTTRYRDGYEQQFESLEAFNAFRDARQSESCAFQCVLTYVINFPAREKPEKQEVVFLIRNVRALEEYVTNKNSLSLFSSFALGLQETGTARVGLEYTEISWGNDLENLISQYLLTKFSKLSRFSANLKAMALGFLIVVSSFGPLVYVTTSYQRYIDTNRAAAALVIANNTSISTLEKIQQKIDLLLSFRNFPLTRDQLQTLITSTFGFLVAVGALIFMLLSRRQSFLTMNDFTKELYGRYVRRYEMIRYAVVTAFVVGLIASLGASFLYDAIKYIR